MENELKTLKDFDWIEEDYSTTDEETIKDELKAEAVKRVKNCDVRGRYGIHCNDQRDACNRCKACKRDIWFNNLTEEDLA